LNTETNKKNLQKMWWLIYSLSTKFPETNLLNHQMN